MSSFTSTRAQIDAFGDPELLHLAELPVRDPAPGEIRIEVAATTVNPVDVWTRMGRIVPEADARFPMVLGWDVAGIVERVGDGVEGWQVGDRVAAMSFQPRDQNGTYAQHVNLAADLLAPVPDGLPLEQAATIPLAGLTASQIVRWLDLPAGGTLLVNGPVGAVGRLVLQLAARDGARVIAVVRPEGRDTAVELGATQVVGRGGFAAEVRDLHPDGVDAAVDIAGGAAGWASLASVRDGGAYVTVVPPYNDPTGPFTTQRDIRFGVMGVEPDTADLGRLLEAAARGELTTAIDRTYPLAESAEAHRRQLEGGLRGKLVLIP